MPQGEQTHSGGRLRGFLLLVLLFLGINLVLGVESYLYSLPKNPKAPWYEYVNYAMPQWAPWILLTPLARRLARRFRLDRQPGPRVLLVHALALPGILGLHLLLMSAFIFAQRTLLYDVPVVKMSNYFRELPAVVPVAWALRSLLTYGVIQAVGYAADYRRELRDRQVQASRLEGQLARAQLQTLKSQLHPHFLFNSLNAISTLMRTDLDGAERMLDMLAELLRRSLRESGVQEVGLHQELDFVGRYLDIEQVRFSNRLRVEVDLPEALKAARVPHLILQPLVENAIRHGLGPKVGPGTLGIRARREGTTLVLEVLDDGVGPRPRRSPQEGVGLANTRARLQQLYGDQASLEAGGTPGEGFRVLLRLPWRPMEEA